LFLQCVKERRLRLFSVVEGYVEERRSVIPAPTGDLLNLLLMPHGEMAQPAHPPFGLWVVSVAGLAEGQDVPETMKLTVLT
jgi:hypothetical protein